MVLSPPKIEDFRREQQRAESQAWRNTAGLHMWNAGLYKQGGELMSCSDPERAWQALACPNGHEEGYHPIVPSCKLPYCPICSHARSAELAREYTPIVQDALNASPDTHRLRHITLTTPYSINNPQIEQLTRSIWRKAILTLETAFGAKQRTWKDKDIGVLGGWEFGGKGLKLHIHLMVLSPWLDQEHLRQCWQEATDGICQIAWITKVASVEAGVTEVTKYATKLTGLPPSLVPTLHAILTGKRRIRAYGAFSWKLDKVEPQPMECPVCKELLVLSPLLHLRLGNNFAIQTGEKETTTPQTHAHPPPEQVDLGIPGFRRPDSYKFFEKE